MKVYEAFVVKEGGEYSPHKRARGGGSASSACGGGDVSPLSNGKFMERFKKKELLFFPRSIIQAVKYSGRFCLSR